MRLGVLEVGPEGADLSVVDEHSAASPVAVPTRSFPVPRPETVGAGMTDGEQELLSEAVGSAALAAARAGCADLLAFSTTSGPMTGWPAVLDGIHALTRVRVRVLTDTEVDHARSLAARRWAGPGPCEWGVREGLVLQHFDGVGAAG